jgi:hypothetical protein
MEKRWEEFARGDLSARGHLFRLVDPRPVVEDRPTGPLGMADDGHLEGQHVAGEQEQGRKEKGPTGGEERATAGAHDHAARSDESYRHLHCDPDGTVPQAGQEPL